jgi:hypothetical protein
MGSGKSEELKVKLFTIGLVPIAIFGFLSGMLFWAHYPIGTYDLAGDLWDVANLMTSYLDVYDYSNDYFLAHKELHTFRLTHIIPHILWYLIFNDFERYISVLNPVYFCLGCSLLYLIIYKVSESRFIAFFSSLLFSSATVWFGTGDIFALIPIYGTVNKSLGYILYLGILLVLFSYPLSSKTLSALTALIALMVWIHPITYAGPALATLIVIFAYYLWTRKENIRVKLLWVLLSMALMLFVVAPYVYIFGSRVNKKSSQNFTTEEKAVFVDDYQKMRRGMYKPLKFVRLRQDLKLIRGYRIMLYLAIALTAATLIFSRKNKHIIFLSASALICFSVNFVAWELEYLFFNSEGITKLNPLARNSKWMYFFSYLIVLSSYPDFRRHIKSRYAVLLYNMIFLASIIICLNAPLKLNSWINTISYGRFWKQNDKYTYGTLYRSLTHNYIGMKLAKKWNLCNLDRKNILRPRLDCFCPDENMIDILTVNEDVEDVTSFIKRIPPKFTFSGPLWLRYKGHRSLAFSESDGKLYLQAWDRKYLEWKDQKRSYNSLINDGLLSKEPQEAIEEARKIKADFLFVEKFRHGYVDEYNSHVFIKRNYDFAGLPLIYENNSFAIIDLRKSNKNSA